VALLQPVYFMLSHEGYLNFTWFLIILTWIHFVRYWRYLHEIMSRWDNNSNDTVVCHILLHNKCVRKLKEFFEIFQIICLIKGNISFCVSWCVFPEGHYENGICPWFHLIRTSFTLGKPVMTWRWQFGDKMLSYASLLYPLIYDLVPISLFVQRHVKLSSI
jgi:hypothetical protein